VSGKAVPIDPRPDGLEASVRPRRLARANAHATHAWVATVGALCFAVNIFFSRYLFWDSYLDLTSGRLVAHHGIPRHEVLTTAARHRWIDQQWLANWTYYEAWRLGGYPLLAIVSSLLIALGFALLCALLITRRVPAQRAFLWTLAALVVCFGNTVIRAQSFAYPLFVLLLWAILADARRPGPRFLLVVPLLVLWSNLHGTVLLAIGLVVGYSVTRLFLAVRERRSHLAAVYFVGAAGGTAALFANPYGFSIVRYYSALIGNRVVAQYIVEWRAPSLGSFVSLGFFVLLFVVIAVAAYGLGRGYRPSPTLFVIATALALLATRGVRYQAWFALAGVVLAAETLAAVRPAPPELSARLRKLGVVSVSLFAVVAVGVVSRTNAATFEALAPHQAMSAVASYIAGHPHSRILADDQSSSALLWLYPKAEGHVAFDARLEQYPGRDLQSWFNYITGREPGWPDLARSYDVLLASRKGNPALAARLESLSGWRVIGSDPDGIALVRRSSQRAERD
jgi:hypothetical protein